MKISEAEKLTIFRIGLKSNIVTTQQIENWALKTFMNSNGDRIDYLLELCSAVRLGINDVLQILNMYQVSNPTIKEILYGMAGVLYEQHKIELPKACYFISRIAADISSETEYDLFALGLDDLAFLANQGIYGDLQEIEKDFFTLTNEFKPLAINFMKEAFEN